MAVIIGNSALMATSFYGQPEEMQFVVECINYAFTGIYVLEFALKVGAKTSIMPSLHLRVGVWLQGWLQQTGGRGQFASVMHN